MTLVERVVPADHPALAGHFPGRPVVPAALLLDEIVRVAGKLPGAPRTVGMDHVKFLRPLAPGEPFSIELAPARGNEIRFSCAAGGATVMRGVLRLAGDR